MPPGRRRTRTAAPWLAAAVAVALGTVGPPAAAVTPLEAVADLNDWRAEVGVGPVEHDAAASAGCRLHAEYWRLNALTGHFEQPGLPGYTAAGDAAARRSNLLYGGGPDEGPRSWADAVYHRLGLLHPRLTRSGFWSEHGLACMAVLPRDRGPSSAGVSVHPYPAEGQTGVPADFGCNESPNPCQSVPGNPGTVPVGSIPSVQFDGPWEVVEPRVTAALLAPEGGVPVALTVEDADSPRAPFLGDGVALIPHAPLRGNTRHTVAVAAVLHTEDAEVPVAHAWTFTTRPLANVVVVSAVPEVGAVAVDVRSGAADPRAHASAADGGRHEVALQRTADGWSARVALAAGSWEICAASGGGGSEWEGAERCQRIVVPAPSPPLVPPPVSPGPVAPAPGTVVPAPAAPAPAPRAVPTLRRFAAAAVGPARARGVRVSILGLPALRGRTLVVERLRAGRWRAAVRVRVAPRGALRIRRTVRVGPVAAGSRRIVRVRVRVLPATGRIGFVTPARRVRVA